jgi:hypothetical protein
MQAVRAAQEDHERRVAELVGAASGHEVSIESIQREFAAIQDSFAADTSARNERLEQIRRRLHDT